MDKTYIHLIITDLPIFASMLGGFVLAFALWKKSDHTTIAAYFLLLIGSIGAGISFYTGGVAKKTIMNLQGEAGKISESIIEKHQQFALYTLIVLIVLGVVSLAGLYLTIKKNRFAKTTSIILLVLSFVSFGLGAKTGSLGGEIRHTEIRTNSGGENEGYEQENDMKNEGEMDGE